MDNQPLYPQQPPPVQPQMTLEELLRKKKLEEQGMLSDLVGMMGRRPQQLQVPQAQTIGVRG